MGRRQPIALLTAALLLGASCRPAPAGFSCELPPGWERLPPLAGAPPSLSALRLLDDDDRAAGAAAYIDEPRTEAAVRAEAAREEADLRELVGFRLEPLTEVRRGAFSGWEYSVTVPRSEPWLGHGLGEKSLMAVKPPAKRLIRETRLTGVMNGRPVRVEFEAPDDAYDALQPEFDRILETLRAPRR